MGGTSPDSGGSGGTATTEIHLEHGQEKWKDIKDRGYAWVVALACFISFSIFGAFMRCEGIYYVMFMSKYKESAQLTAWLGAIANTLHSFSAPLATMLVNRFSVRTAVMLAAMLSSLGYFLTSFATNIYWLFLTYSVLQGLGRCLTLTPAFISVSMYFDERRGQALAFATSGAAFGALFIVPLTQWLTDTYQFQGAFMISSGVAMNGLVCAFLFRPFSLHQKFNKRRALTPKVKNYSSLETSTHKDSNSTVESDTDSNCGDESPAADSSSTTGRPEKDSKEPSNTTDSGQHSKSEESEDQSDRESYQSLTSSSRFDNEGPDTDSTCQSRKKNGYHQLKSTDPSDMDDVELGDGGGSETKKKKQEHSVRETVCSFAKSCRDAVSTCFAVDSYDKTHATKSKIFHFSIFSHVPFVFMCFSMIFSKLGNKTVLDFLPAICLERGLTDTDISFVISVVQIADICGKLCVGYVMDLPSLRRFQEINLVMLLFTGAGLSLAVTLLSDVRMFSVVGGLYSFFAGATTNQRTVVVTKIFDEGVLTSCFGVLYAFQGVGSLIGPPLSGAMKDIYGEYKYTYIFTGASLAVSGCLVTSCLLIVAVKNRRESSRLENQHTKTTLSCFSGRKLCPSWEKVDVWSMIRRVGAISRSRSASTSSEYSSGPPLELVNARTPLIINKNEDGQTPK